MVEIFDDGSGRCGGKLHSCESLPVYHPDKYTGKRKPLTYRDFVRGAFDTVCVVKINIMMSTKKSSTSKMDQTQYQVVS